ncbi:MAG TPA: FxsA family protein [Gammaproteobacteria bacterium]|nr:FxsA family protein [Gammaproteobacteria bacterium]
MSLIHWLFLLFLTVPLAEIYVLLKVGSVIGALPTVGAVVLTAVIGAALVRVQGFSTLAHIRDSLNRGEVPAVALVEGAFLLVAGALLLTPGFITDAVGFACLCPPLRRYLISEYLLQKLIQAGGRSGARRDSDVIEGEFHREDENSKDNNRLR